MSAPAPPIAVINVSRWYGNIVAVNDISFALGPGITGLLGPNGAGKSTMLHMLSGFLRPSAGELRVFGETRVGEPGHVPANRTGAGAGGCVPVPDRL